LFVDSTCNRGRTTSNVIEQGHFEEIWKKKGRGREMNKGDKGKRERGRTREVNKLRGGVLFESHDPPNEAGNNSEGYR